MSSNTSHPIGLSIPSRPQQPLSTIDSVDSVLSLTPTRTSTPLSPFDHPPPFSLSQQPNKADSKSHLSTYESDLEAGCPTEYKTSGLALAQKKSSGGATNKECTVWPGQKALKEAKMAEKRRTECWNPMRGLESRTKFWVKIAIGAVIVGLAVGVGLGITRAVHGGVWHQDS
ncbi:hypothetical protein GMDG_03973 [Pseudogymnoascus destructans 20631-21]|uniref:Uncharacterized protein n=1 Tax=Pseudogymnoascus destructans (strain ATCC MYA-4855 / 20631-21) TaxID=658429 RepID=L8G951_PSED2|nr:hypothetical protein GMDG_03973 [Pseudogymnoascus destructans 20631-21]